MLPILKEIHDVTGLPIDHPVFFAAAASEKFDSDKGRANLTAPVIGDMFTKLFKMELPAAQTANPRKEASIQMRYMILNVMNMTSIDLPQAYANAVNQTKKLFTDQPYLLLEGGVVDKITTASGTVITGKKSGYIKGTGKTGKTKGAKQNKAAELFEANKGKTRQELIALFMKELDMSKAGASTYVYNCQKKAGVTSNKKGKKAKTEAEKVAVAAAKAAAPKVVKKPKGRAKKAA